MNKKTWKYIFGVQILAILSLSIALFSLNSRRFKLIACDVGQGDAILAIYGNLEILNDGGPDSKVIECLDKYMPYWDREIELVILSHPDKDHFGGLIDVFERYKVDSFLRTKAKSSTQSFQMLENLVGGEGIETIYAKEGLRLRLGKIYLDILNPINSESLLSGDVDLNNSSIVFNLSFGEFNALLTGDIEIEGINKMVSGRRIRDIEYLKVPHHGSSNNITTGLLMFSKPEISAISVGKNSYGHPNKETLELLARYKIKVLRTDEIGDIVIEANEDGTFYLY